MENEGEKSRVRVKVRERVERAGRRGIRPLDLLLLLAAGAMVGLSLGYLAAGGFKRFFLSSDFTVREEGILEGERAGKSPVRDLFSLEEEETSEVSGPSEEDPFLDFEEPS